MTGKKLSILFVVFLIIVLLFLNACTVTSIVDDNDALTLRQLAEKGNIYVGTAINHLGLTHPTDEYVDEYIEIMGKEFNLIIPECNLQMKKIWKSEYDIDFTNLDIELDYANAHNMKVRGQLLWYRSVPEWLVNGFNSGLYTGAEIETLIKWYILTVMNHIEKKCPGMVQSWQIVNEAIGPEWNLSDNGVYGLRTPEEDFFIAALGNDYVGKAFHWADEYYPDSNLIYNDYRCEFRNSKAEAVYKFVSGLVKDGVPIDGIGLQCHFNLKLTTPDYSWIDFSIESISEYMDRYLALGLTIDITELDYGVNYDNRGISDEKLNAQADFYYALTKMALAKDGLTSISTWGFTDRLSWLNKENHEEWGLIFDKQLKKKKAYIEYRRAFEETFCEL